MATYVCHAVRTAHALRSTNDSNVKTKTVSDCLIFQRASNTSFVLNTFIEEEKINLTGHVNGPFCNINLKRCILFYCFS
jgi:hypothetical protein